MRVLHVPYQFGESELGGTEIYVASLCDRLRPLGIQSAIGAPGSANRSFVFGETPVFEFAISPQSSFEAAYGAPDEVASENFRDVLEKWRPDIVHLHSRSAAVSQLLLRRARRSGCKLVYTYHTPTSTCVRGTMMHMGEMPCNGILDLTCCTACNLERHGVPSPVRELVARVPQAIGLMLERHGSQGGAYTALRMRHLVASVHKRARDFLAEMDRVVAVCDWVADVLRRNGTTEPKLVLSRQGLAYSSVEAKESADQPAGASSASTALAICYFGRLDSSKGIQTLVRAIRGQPSLNVGLCIYGVRQRGDEDFQRSLLLEIGNDLRIRLLPAVPADEVVRTMRTYHLAAVPSEWLETGPLVVLEAFAAGIPVLGSRLGGIAELVRHGVDGWLVDAGNVDAWSKAIASLEGDRTILSSLSSQISSPRTMKDAALEMANLYRGLS